MALQPEWLESRLAILAPHLLEQHTVPFRLNRKDSTANRRTSFTECRFPETPAGADDWPPDFFCNTGTASRWRAGAFGTVHAPGLRCRLPDDQRPERCHCLPSARHKQSSRTTESPRHVKGPSNQSFWTRRRCETDRQRLSPKNRWSLRTFFRSLKLSVEYFLTCMLCNAPRLD